jgi:hypothetical protein
MIAKEIAVQSPTEARRKERKEMFFRAQADDDYCLWGDAL